MNIYFVLEQSRYRLHFEISFVIESKAFDCTLMRRLDTAG